MAQIDQSAGGGKKKKGAQKKMPIHVDFTPMVDMNMLLITFFMLCTTMLKSQTLKIALPTNEKVSNEQKNQAGESQAITLLLDVERDAAGNPVEDSFGNRKTIIYYYEGSLKTDEAGNPLTEQLKTEAFIGNKDNVQQGIRKILHDRNKTIIAEVNKLKEKWRNNEFSQDDEENQRLYEEAANKARNNNDLKYPIVMIKATPEATWESVIGALDEMSINEISHYQLENLNNQERKMLKLPLEEETPAAGAAAPAAGK